MKSLLIAIKPKWCAKIMNGTKTIEVRKNKALANAIQKLINEYGYADIYVYCSKNEYLYRTNKGYIASKKPLTVGKGTEYTFAYSDEGKIIFKFKCYKVEEIEKICGNYAIKENGKSSIHYECWLHKTCLLINELDTYLNGNNGYAIHISDLKIFDEPKELSDFFYLRPCFIAGDNTPRKERIHKAPQNYCYVEIE